MTTIYFDESGNTGRQLADLDQPIFVLGSCDFTPEECAELLRPLRSAQAAEVHFKALRKRPRGQDRIIELLRSDLVTIDRFKAHVTHKRFMLLTKILDELVEYMLYYRHDVNFYENGLNLALSNMLFHTLPLAVGQDLYDQFLGRYYDMCTQKTDEAFDAFYHHLSTMVSATDQTGFRLDDELALLHSTQSVAREALEDVPKHSFNPAIPAFFMLCVYWGRKHTRFEALCDDSEPLENQADFFRSIAEMRAMGEQQEVIGHGNAQIELPLRLDNMAFIASHESDGIQVTDVITSALAYYLTKKMKNEHEDEFFRKLDALGKLDELVSNCIWPTLDVTPEALGRAGDEGRHNPADAFAAFLRGRQQ